MIDLIQGDCLEVMKDIPDKSIDCIITDPPYLYLKHKLDRKFDENKFFKECYRVLKKDSFLVFFGRGLSFYRWNTTCDNLGFKFKEEVIWDKTQITSPFLKLGRTHETISVLSKGTSIINKVRIDKIQSDFNAGEYQKSVQDLKRIKSELKKFTKIEELKEFLKGKYGKKEYTGKHNITLNKKKEQNRGYKTYKSYTKGMILKSIIRVNREHYTMEHPTQKPVELMQYLIRLVSNENDTVLDCFMGSGTTGVACKNLKRNFIGIELDKDYFNLAKNRIENTKVQGSLF